MSVKKSDSKAQREHNGAMEYYLQEIAQRATPTTLKSYRGDLQKFFDFLERDGIPPNRIIYPLSSYPETIAPQTISRFIKYLRVNLRLSPTTCNHIITVCRGYWDYRLRGGIVESNPWRKVSPISYEHKLPICLTVDEAQRFCDGIGIDGNPIDGEDPLSLRNRAVAETLYDTGLRAAEFLSMGLEKMRENYFRVIGKGNKERFVPASDEMIARIEQWKADGRTKIVKKGAEGWLWLSHLGTKLSSNGLWMIVRDRAMRTIGREIHPHTLRHSCASHLLAGGASVRVVQDILGHSSLNTTMIYTHIDGERLKNIYNGFHPRA